MAQEESATQAFEKMAQDWQNLMIDSWSGMTRQYVGSDGFAAASSAYLDWALAAQKQIRNNTAQFMDSLEFPKRSDLARLSKQIAHAEQRIADCEDTLDKILKTLQSLESKVDAKVKAAK